MKKAAIKDIETPNCRNWTRRDFTLKSALLILSSVPITIAACGGDSSPSTPTPTPTSTPTPSTGNVEGAIGTNHGHTVTITSADLTAGNALSLDITGTSDHPHTVEITVAEVGQIAQGMQVQTTSSSEEGHTHTVTFN